MSAAGAAAEPPLTVVTVTVDGAGAMIEASAGFLRIIDTAELRLNGGRVDQFFIQPDFATLVTAQPNADGEVYRGLVTIGDYDGRTRSLRARVWRADKALRIVAEYDIEEMERVNDTVLELNREYATAQCELAQTNLKMRQLNAELVRAHQDALDARAVAEAASAAKSEFLAHMSHEIRTPMNVVLGLAQFLEGEPLSPEQALAAHGIREAGDSLLHTINDVLDFSKIEAGQLRLEALPFELASVCDRVGNLLRDMAHKKGLQLEVRTPTRPQPNLVGDALRLEQVLVNLISNAIKFTAHGGVVLEVAPIEAATDKVRLRFEVRDTGIGIEPEALNRLFTAFTQADASTTRHFGGTGLGLAISKRLVEQMGGTIGAVSTPGAGSTFWFEIPFACACDKVGVSPAVAASRPDAEELKGLRVLAVDDNRMNLFVVEHLLARKGAIVTLAADGQQALQALKARPQGFDVVLMDVQMPVMDGLTATRRIRSDPELAAIPVIALTAGVMAEEREAALAAGVNGILAKPVDNKELGEVLAAYAPSRASTT